MFIYELWTLPIINCCYCYHSDRYLILTNALRGIFPSTSVIDSPRGKPRSRLRIRPVISKTGGLLSLSLSIHLSIFRSNTRIAFSVKPQPTAATRVSFRAFELLTVINRPDIIRPPLRFIKVSHRDILPVERTDHDRVKGKLKGIRETRKRWATTSNDDRFETVF